MGFASVMRILFLMLLMLLIEARGEVERTQIEPVSMPSLSTDGKMLVFGWMNDIWVGSSDGGEMRRLVAHPAADTRAKFSPDGKRIVFCSDRTGSSQIYSVSMDGDDLVQHSDHSEGYSLENLTPDGKYAVSRGIREGIGYRAFRLLKTDLKSTARELVLFDATAHTSSLSADGSRLLFCRDGEKMFRSGYRGSRASEIHSYDVKTGEFTKLIDEEWESRMPMIFPDGKGFYYLSNANGKFNVWKRDLSDNSDKQLTFFKDESVVSPSLSMDGSLMVFVVGDVAYRFAPESGKDPVKLKFFTEEKVKSSRVRKERVSGTSSVAFADEGKRIVFSAAGDLWTMEFGDKEPMRLTESDNTDERELQLSKDGQKIFYLSDDGLECRLMQAMFAGGEIGKVEEIAAGVRSKRNLRISPDGSCLSWLEATGDLVTYKLGEHSANVVMPCWDMPTYDWSPDGKWLVVAAKDVNSNRDIWLVAADGSRDPFNLTEHPAFEGSPKWSPDGEKIAFTARRNADGLASLWVINVAVHLAGDDFSDEDLKNIADSVKPIETEVSEPMRVVWSPDSKALLFQSRDVEDHSIYRLAVDGGEVTEFAGFRGLPARGVTEKMTAWRINRVPCLYDGKDLREFVFSFVVSQDRSARQRLAFRKIWRTLSERFYDENMAGADWDEMLVRLEDSAANAREPWQFDRVIARLLGELNASHLTFKTMPWGAIAEKATVSNPTAHSGLIFQNSWDGDLVISRVVVGSPISMEAAAPVAGDIVRRIGGRDVDARTPLQEFFNGAAGRPLPVVIEDAKGKQRTMELMPISYKRMRFLERKAREAEAKRVASEHGFAYLPFRKMKSSHLDDLAVEVYRSSLQSKGLILDLRDNAGGRVADELLALFCQPVHTFTLPRNGPRGYPNDRRVSPSWEGPLVVLCNQNTYSNAEIFCHAFKRMGRGKLVGMPTNGGVISAVNVRIPELGELQIPFRGWFHADTGKDLELNGAVPDLIVPNLPADQVSGRDAQFEAALETLKKEIGVEKNQVDPIYK